MTKEVLASDNGVDDKSSDVALGPISNPAKSSLRSFGVDNDPAVGDIGVEDRWRLRLRR